MAEELDLDLGVAGASARREYERRRAKREARVREEHPHIGGLLLKLREAPPEEKNWATGYEGEVVLEGLLKKRSPEAIVLHDRRMPRSRANIDHLAIARSGVYVIDSKRYKGRIEVRKRSSGDPQLWIHGRNKTKLVDGLRWQTQAVQDALGSVAPRVHVQGCFCFLSPAGHAGRYGLPLWRTLQVSDYPLLYPHKVAKLLNQPGELGAAQVQLIAEALAARFPSA